MASTGGQAKWSEVLCAQFPRPLVRVELMLLCCAVRSGGGRVTVWSLSAGYGKGAIALRRRMTALIALSVYCCWQVALLHLLKS